MAMAEKGQSPVAVAQQEHEQNRSAPEPEVETNTNGAVVDATKAEEKEVKEQGKQDDDSKAGKRSPHRKDRSRQRRRRSRSRSRSRDRYRRRSRSRDRARRRRSRSRSRSRDRRDRRPREHDRRDRRRESPEEHLGYRPRRRVESPDARIMASIEDPFAKLRSAASTSMDPAEIARQMQEQQLKARQLVLQQQAASAVAAASKTQREIYVGNLAAGLVTDVMLHQLFSTTMAAAFPDKCEGMDPVVKVSLAPEGKYAFIELRSSEMSSAALQLNQQVQLMGSTLSIGRPAGYVDPGKASAAAQSAAEALARFQAESQAARRAAGVVTEESMAKEETPFLCVAGMITADVLANEQEYAEVVADIKEEFERHGTVLRVAVPRPEGLADVGEAAELIRSGGPCGKAYVQFLEAEGAKAARSAVEGRLFAGQRVEVAHMQPQEFMTAVGQSS